MGTCRIVKTTRRDVLLLSRIGICSVCDTVQVWSESSFTRGSGFGLLKEEEIDQSGLSKEDGGNAKGELAVLGLVAEDVHPQEGADTAAGDGQPDEGVFRDAPLPSPGLPFIDAVDQEGQDVDADEVDDEVAHKVLTRRARRKL